MSVRALRRGSIAASRPGGTPTTYTIFGDAADGYVDASSAAGDGSGGTVTSTTPLFAGGSGSTRYEAFLAFDTSVIPDGATIMAATLSLWGTHINLGGGAFTIDARAYDWGATLETADWRSLATMATLPLLASRSTTGWSTSGYNAFTSQEAFLTAINKSGFTRLIVGAATSSYVGFSGGDQAGTSQDPKLVIEALV